MNILTRKYEIECDTLSHDREELFSKEHRNIQVQIEKKSKEIRVVRRYFSKNFFFQFGSVVRSGKDDDAAKYKSSIILLTLKGPIPYIYGTQVWLSLCLQMS